MAPWSRATIRGASLALLAALGCLAGADKTTVPIHTAPVFPESWRYGEINASYVPLDLGEAGRSFACVRTACELYPAELLKPNLKAVYLAKELRFYGLNYGGTNSFDSVYIANGGLDAGYTDAFLKSVFHHEFSSILLRNYSSRFDPQGWAAHNRPGYRYGDGGIEALKGGKSETVFRAQYNVDGFLNQYGTASIEEDFNTFAEALFSGDRSFWVLVDRYPRLEEKMRLTVAFYAALHPKFDEAFFRGLAGV